MLSDNDIGSLFEKHNVVDIKNILGQTRKNIENKKEELRVMVGERYRDLIEAADTISQMQKSTEDIVQNIKSMEDLCQSLNQRGLIGFKTKHLSSNLSSSEDFSHYAVAAEIKILVDVPEVLWNLCDKHNFISAAQIFLLAQHTHTTLQLSSNNSQVFNTFPLINGQWASISHFKLTITKGCVHIIKSDDVTVQAVLNAVCALLLLEGTTVAGALERLLAHRKAKLQSILTPVPSRVAKDQLALFVESFMSSVIFIAEIFAETHEEKCLLIRKLNAIGDSESGATPISFLPETSLSLQFLPKSLLTFRCKPLHTPESITKLVLQEKVVEWMTSVVAQSSTSVRTLLSHTTSVKVLSLMREKIYEVQFNNASSTKWSKILAVCNIENEFSPWKAVIQDAVLERSRIIITNELDKIQRHLLKLVKNITEEIIKIKRVCMEEGDITNFVWSESAQDMPDQVNWSSVYGSTPINKNTGLFYKSRGYTKRIQCTAKTLNSMLTNLIEDISQFLKVPSKFADVVDNTSVAQDYEMLLQHVENESKRAFLILLANLETIANDTSLHGAEADDCWEPTKTLKPTAESTVIIFISRLITSLAVICPKFKVTLCASLLGSQDSAKRLHMGLPVTTEAWDNISGNIVEISERLLCKFFALLLEQFCTQMKQELIESVSQASADSLLNIYANWENIPIEEEGENGPIQSVICIPSQPTPALSQALMRLCLSIEHIGIHTVSKTLHVELVKLLCDAVCSTYGLLKPHIEDMNEKTALQLIFDIKLLQGLIISRDNEEHKNELTNLVKELNAKVDPFDLNVFNPHMTSHVRGAVQKLNVLFGGIIPREKHIIDKNAQYTAGATNSLVVVPSVEIPRFSNVPIQISSGFHSFPKGPQDKDVLHESKTSADLFSLDKNSSKSSIPSSKSASLFSAMSSSWFGS